MVMNNVFSEFSALMHTRLSAPIHNTTEDSIRYTFFAALLKRANVQPHEIALEYPHPAVAGKIVDTYIPSLDGKPVVIEFKYDRNIPSGRAGRKTHNAGALFADIYRLYKFEASESDRLLVYCTDQIMAKYFRKPANDYSVFFDLVQGQTMSIDDKFMSTKPDTVKKRIGGAMNVVLECLWTDNLPQEHYLRIYGVLPQ